MSQRPDFIIIGAMKCATSTLHDQLAGQPGFFMTQLKEPNFFSNDEQFNRGWSWYESLFNGAGPGDLCGESSTHYTKLPTYPKTIDRLHERLADVKLIYVMRHPINRLVSHYIHEWTERTITEPIDEAVDRHPRLIDYSRYTMQLEPFIAAYGKAAILPVFFERLISQPQLELERVCRFLGYGPQPIWNDTEGRKNVSAQRLRKSAARDLLVENSVTTWVRRRFIPQSLRNRIKKLWQMTKKVELGPEPTRRLEALFDEDLATLGRWLGMSLNCEGFKSTVLDTTPDWQDGSNRLEDSLQKRFHSGSDGAV